MSKPPAPPQDLKGIVLSAEEKARQRRRSRAIAIAVAGLVVLFYLITVFKMGASITQRAL